jgi:predicted metal-dependent peptidase
MAVNTQTRTVYVNTEWLEKLPIPQRAYVFAHEATHILMGHCKWKAKLPVQDQDMGGTACDMAVFSILSHSALDKLRGDIPLCQPSDAGLAIDLTVDQYLAALKAKQQSQHQQSEPEPQDEDEEEQDDETSEDETGPRGEADGDSEDEDDDSDGEGDSESGGDESGNDGDEFVAGTDSDGADSEDAVAPDDTDSDGDGGTDDSGMGAGSGDEDGDDQGLRGMDDIMPDDGTGDIDGGAAPEIIDALKNAGFGSGMFSAVMEARKADDVNWQVVLANFMQKNMGKTTYSFARPSRRHLWRGMVVPGASKDDRMESMAVLLDTSGSITDAAVQKALGAIGDIVDKTAGPNFELHLLQFSSGMEDYKCYQKRDLPLKAIEIHGRGGTEIGPAFKYMLDHRIAPRAVIVITDGYIFDLSQVPAPPIPVLWLIDGAYGRFECPFGIKVPIY